MVWVDGPPKTKRPKRPRPRPKGQKTTRGQRPPKRNCSTARKCCSLHSLHYKCRTHETPINVAGAFGPLLGPLGQCPSSKSQCNARQEGASRLLSSGIHAGSQRVLLFRDEARRASVRPGSLLICFCCCFSCERASPEMARRRTIKCQ
jgi:hypothetical protein